MVVMWVMLLTELMLILGLGRISLCQMKNLIHRCNCCLQVMTVITVYVTAAVRTSPRVTRRGKIAPCLTYYQSVDVV